MQNREGGASGRGIWVAVAVVLVMVGIGALSFLTGPNSPLETNRIAPQTVAEPAQGSSAQDVSQQPQADDTPAALPDTEAQARPEDPETAAAPEVEASSDLPQVETARPALPVQDTASAVVPSQPEEAPQDAADTPAPQETAAAPSAVAARDVPLPTIDSVRFDGTGVLVVSGRSAPAEAVDVLIDGGEVASTETDRRGAFAALATLAASDAPRVLSLRVRRDGQAVLSLDQVILAPQQRQVAQAPDQTAAPQDAPAPSTDPAGTAANSPKMEPGARSPAAAQVETADVAADGVAPAPTEPSADVTPPTNDVVAEAPPAAVTEQQAPKPEPAPDTATSLPQDTATVEAPAVAVLKSTGAGVSLVQPALSEPDAVALDTIGYSDSGVVRLSGRAGEDAASVRVYIDNRPVARLEIDGAGGWRGDVPDIDTGIYTLRVDAVDAGGDVTSRIETPFKREALAVLAEAATGDGPVQAVTVQTGDTLWAIARDRYGEGVLYVRVFEANRATIRDPDLIYPGQVFDLPAE